MYIPVNSMIVLAHYCSRRQIGRFQGLVMVLYYLDNVIMTKVLKFSDFYAYLKKPYFYSTLNRQFTSRLSQFDHGIITLMRLA